LRDVKIFDNFFDPAGGLDMIARYGHVLVGITWIGLLYFFNFVQVPAYAELSDGARSEALRKLTWRALWWFRYAALATFLFGVALVLTRDDIGDYFESAQGYSITTGMLFGITMFANVWGVIWRNQQIVIGSANRVASGGQADPAAPAAAKRAARASRANTFMSFTMLWFMIYTPHFASALSEPEGKGVYIVFLLVVWAFVEGSALGLIGGLDSPFNKAVFDKHRDTIIYGFVLLAVVYFIGWELLADVERLGG
jgi:uncharacterized membrane protein